MKNTKRIVVVVIHENRKTERLRINDFTISFESHYYFTTSVKRGFEIIYLLSVR